MASKFEKLLNKARTQVRKGNLPKALNLYKDACKHDPLDQTVWNERALIAERVGDKIEAADSYYQVADIFERRGMHAQAANMVKRVLSLNPEHAGAKAATELLANYMGGFQTQAPRAEKRKKSRRSATKQSAEPQAPVVEMEAAEPPPTPAAKQNIDLEFSGRSGTQELEAGDYVEMEVEGENTNLYDTKEVSSTDVGPPQPPPPEVPALDDEDSRGGAAALEEAVGDGDSGPIPGQLTDEWKSARKGPGEHRISHHSAQLAVADVIDVSAEDPGDVPEPEVEMDMFEAVCETIPISPLLSELDSDMLRFLIDNSRLRHKAPGQPVFTEGDKGGNLFLILRGEVVIERRNEKNDALQRVATLRPGAFFGEMSLLTDAPRSATVRAVSMLSLLDIPPKTIRTIVEQQTRVRKLLMRFFRARMVGSLMTSSELFKPFSVEDRRKLVTRFRLRELPPGQVVLQKGARSDGLYLVLAGHVQVFVPDKDVVLADLTAGDVFGEIALLEDCEITASVRAKTRGWVLRLPRDDFKELISSYPKVLEKLDAMAKQRKATNAKILAGSRQSSA